MKIIEKMHPIFHLKCLACWFSLAFGFPSYAQQQDAIDAIYVFSDSNTISGLSSEGERVITYIGNVRLTQGLMEITGDEAVVTLNSNSNEVVNALVTGNPVYFQRSSELDEPETTGNSESIEFKVRESQVVFEGDVTFNQPGIKYECGRLLYSVESDLAQGTGGCQVSIAN